MMALEGSTKCIKYLVVFFNFLFFLLGCCLIGIGVWGEITIGPYAQLSSIDYLTGPRVVMALGAILAIVAFLGCCGAMKENKCMLSLFFALLLILLILEITAAVLAFRNKDKIKEVLEKDIRRNIVEYPTNDPKAIDDLQSKLECCGANGPNDWMINDDYIKTNHTSSVPDSCCTAEYKSQDCGKGQRVNQTKIYKDGCYPKLKKKIEDNLVPTGALAVTMLVIQILGMVFAIILICRIN